MRKEREERQQYEPEHGIGWEGGEDIEGVEGRGTSSKYAVHKKIK